MIECKFRYIQLKFFCWGKSTTGNMKYEQNIVTNMLFSLHFINEIFYEYCQYFPFYGDFMLVKKPHHGNLGQTN